MSQTFYFGSSLRAIRDLNRLLGYTLVAVDAQAVNAFFIRDDILECQGAQVRAQQPHQQHGAAAARRRRLPPHCPAPLGAPPAWLVPLPTGTHAASSPAPPPCGPALPPSRRRGAKGVCSVPVPALQPLPIEELYVHNPPAPNVPETNQTRQWLFLDEAGNVVKKEFRPV